MRSFSQNGLGIEKQSNIPALLLGRLNMPIWCSVLLRTLVAMYRSVYGIRGITVMSSHEYFMRMIPIELVFIKLESAIKSIKN